MLTSIDRAESSDAWGWAGTVREFLSLPLERWLESLHAHHVQLWRTSESGSQRAAWSAEHGVMVLALRACVEAKPDTAPSWGVVFEFELPMEGGRRPDVVVLAGGSLVVIEFKSSVAPSRADFDQTIGYLRDLCDYHAGSHHLNPHGVLVLMGASPALAREVDGIVAVGPASLHPYLYKAESDGQADIAEWCSASYQPLPTLVDAARRIFRDEPLPHVRAAESVGIPETVELLGRIVDESAAKGGRTLSFVTGVPGAGKTLVGLRLVHERTEMHGRATFLSGNGPLVQVLQDALHNRVFVRDLHAFIKTYALNLRQSTPDEHVIVFDEAQRAWDSDYMHLKKGVQQSEPQLLIGIGERITDWAALVGLVGEGQEIHSGEEAGIAQWRTAALAPTAQKPWTIHCPPRLAHQFDGLDVQTHERLDLTVTLRSHRAEDLHQWVRLLLEGSLALATRVAVRIPRSYPIYLTRSLDEARRYVRDRFDGAPQKRAGLLASSHAKMPPRHGVDNSYLATSRMNVAKWFNAPPEDPKSSNQLIQPVTEFGCQGLELDLPIVCWGEDYRWHHDSWRLTPIRRRYVQDDPEALLTNAYRVLLTRGRDGLVIFVPPDSVLDGTEVALLAAGVRPIPSSAELLEITAQAL